MGRGGRKGGGRRRREARRAREGDEEVGRGGVEGYK